MFDQSLGALKQLECDSALWKSGSTVIPPQIVIQSGALFGNIKDSSGKGVSYGETAVTNGYKQTLSDLNAFAKKQCSQLKKNGDDYFNKGCLVLNHYYIIFRTVLGLPETTPILIISDSDWIAAGYRWLSSHSSVFNDVKWPFPDTNAIEDIKYPST